MTLTPRAASRLATSAAAPPATATGPAGPAARSTASESTSSPISRKIRPRRLVVAHHSVRPPSWGSESASASPTVTPITGRPAATRDALRQGHAATDAGEAAWADGDRDQVEVGRLEAGIAQAVLHHDRQDRGMAPLKILLIAGDDLAVGDDRRRTPGNGRIEGENPHGAACQAMPRTTSD